MRPPDTDLAGRIRARFEATADILPVYRTLGSNDAGKWLTPAAVLAAIVDRPEPTFLFTTRNANLRKHAGQIAFPGGRADPEDVDAIATALREAEEEIALPPAAVTIIGTDAPLGTGTGYSIVPVVAIIPPGLPLAPHELEVADIFEVPLAIVLDPAHQIVREGELGGAIHRFHEISWRDRRIWGATAAILVNLSRRLWI